MEIRFKVQPTLALGLISALVVALPQQTFAQGSSARGDEAIEEIITTGTRRADRSAADSPVPIDVISGAEIRQNSSSDLQNLLRTTVPSFDVNTQPISDAATIVRPPNIRGLSPDQILVLVNGKRRHRGSIISFLGGGISDGAQGVDISAIPSLAIKRVEVLRDGASSQYGSDAIAGVLNFVLRDDAEGAEVVANYGSTSEGDGENYRVAANIGLPLGNSGYINLTGEYSDVEGTVRSVVRDDVLAMIAAGYPGAGDFSRINSYTNEVPQYWGQPDVDDDIKFFVNSAYELNDSAELYFFGNYAQRTVTGGFFYRTPLAETSDGQRAGVYRGPLVDANGFADPNGVTSVLVGDVTGDGSGACVDGIPYTNLTPDAGILAAVSADPDCFSFLETIPNGFVPRFGGDNEDMALSLGLRGEFDLGTGLSYDFSLSQGSNRTDFFIRNTINASLGPNTPRDFVPGGQEQTETIADAGFVYSVDAGLASDLNVAFGAQYRKEEFDLFAGDPQSFALGVLADQGFSSSSNGFGGFPNTTSADQDSVAAYVDLEADVTDKLTLQGAVRYEDFSEFGDTTDFKIAGMYHVTDTFRIRAAYSTGFHAPTAGQANITNVTTQNVNGVLIDQGTLPLSSAAGQLAADYVDAQNGPDAGRPTLGPEEATNLAFGVAFDLGETTWTIDYYQIEVTDRVALGANVDFLDALNFAGTEAGVVPPEFTTVSGALTGLDAAGVINRQEFIGLDDLSEFRFFSNSFDTTTTGVDIVGRFGFALGNGDSDVTVALNYNDTKVDNVGSVNPIDADRVNALENLLPNWKGVVTWTHVIGDLRTLVRGNYYGEWDDTGNGVPGISPEVLVDAEVAYMFRDNIEFIAGVDNLFDTYPDKNPGAGDLGQLYSEASPFGFNGMSWYLRARFTF